MTHFLALNWIWILLVGAMLLMRLRHRLDAHIGGCCVGHMGHQANRDDHVAHDADEGQPTGRDPDHDSAHGSDRSETTQAQRRGSP
jgi:hypothetical protein